MNKGWRYRVAIGAAEHSKMGACEFFAPSGFGLIFMGCLAAQADVPPDQRLGDRLFSIHPIPSP
jgi:hypothetical protein